MLSRPLGAAGHQEAPDTGGLRLSTYTIDGIIAGLVAVHLFASPCDPWPAAQAGLEGTRAAVNVANNVDRSRKGDRLPAGRPIKSRSGAEWTDAAMPRMGIAGHRGAGTFFRGPR